MASSDTTQERIQRLREAVTEHYQSRVDPHITVHRHDLTAALDALDACAAASASAGEAAEQINLLAEFLMEHFGNEIVDEGAVPMAIRLLTRFQGVRRELMATAAARLAVLRERQPERPQPPKQIDPLRIRHG